MESTPKSGENLRFAYTDPTLKIIDAIDKDGAKSQRVIAKRAEIALGLANAYLKRCARKGWIKVRQAPARRYFYYITPKGFKEKARLTAEYLSTSLSMFRVARAQCDDLLARCIDQGCRRIALAGAGDLAEIAALSALNEEIELVAVIDRASNQSRLAGIRIVRSLAEVGPVDAVLITDITNPQETFELLVQTFPEAQLYTPPMLRINPDRRTAFLEEGNE
ncbi:MAG: winged helix-turn-helix transcriptional regulator [Alphaproteobacteria bacterium]